MAIPKSQHNRRLFAEIELESQWALPALES
jgi:hypothetical protein